MMTMAGAGLLVGAACLATALGWFAIGVWWGGRKSEARVHGLETLVKAHEGLIAGLKEAIETYRQTIAIQEKAMETWRTRAEDVTGEEWRQS